MSTLIVLIASFTFLAVLTKSPLISWIIQNFDGDSINSRSLRGDPESDYQDLRFATFGTSRTWGSGLNDRFQAFPYLLSPHVNNLAIRAAGPDIPSQCTATMLGDSMVDVILLEYSFTASDALVRLAHRLRQRFPKATIIFLDIWVPFQFYNRRLGKTVDQIVRDTISDMTLYTPDFLSSVVIDTNPDEWFFLLDEKARSKVEEARALVGGFTYEMPNPDQGKESLLQFGHFFMHDMSHFSVDGHYFLRNEILNLLRSVTAKHHDERNPWATNDHCQSWFESGTLTAIRHSSLKMANFDDEKFALEAPLNETVWINVHNSFDYPMDVFVNHMSIGPDHLYPNVSLMLQQSLDTPNGVIVDNWKSTAKRHIHVVQNTRVGKIPPGMHQLIIQTLDKSKNLPFRLTGILLTPSMDAEYSAIPSSP